MHRCLVENRRSHFVFLLMRQSVARGLELFGEIGCTGRSMRYHPVQQRHQRMRKEWAVADSIGIDATHTAPSKGFPRKRQYY